MNENEMKVKFGLEAQGHIPTIERILSELGTSNESWTIIGKKIGWHPLTACAHYLRYVLEKQLNNQLMLGIQSSFVSCSKFGTTNLCDGCGAAKPHNSTSCEPCPVHQYDTCQPIVLKPGDMVKPFLPLN